MAPPALAEAPVPQTQIASEERVRGGILDASDPPGLARLLVEKGYVATLGADADGDPMIRGRISRSDYAVQFYECETHRFCNSVQFVVEGPAGETASLDALNVFNLRWRYVRAARTGDTVRLLMDLNLDWGVTAANIEDTLDNWRQLVEVFERDFLAPR